MKELKHDDLVRLASWHSSYAKVGTLTGFGAVRRVLSEPEAWTSYAGACISSSKAYYDRETERFATAVVIAHDEVVTIEGKQYKVKVMNGNGGEFPHNCDPIHFIAS